MTFRTLRGLSAPTLLPIILYFVLTAPATTRQPCPWLSKSSDNVLLIVFQIQEPVDVLGGRWNSVELLLTGGVHNVTKAIIYSNQSQLFISNLHPMASITVVSNQASQFLVDEIHIAMPFNRDVCGVYAFVVHYVNTESESSTQSHFFNVTKTDIGKRSVKIEGLVTVSTCMVDQVNITWVPPVGAEGSEHIVTVAQTPKISILPRTVVYKMTSNYSTSEEVVILAQYSKPKFTSCGIQNHTLVLYVRSCFPDCRYTCEVWYPECAAAGGNQSQYCVCGAVPADHAETGVTPVSCDDTTTTIPTTRGDTSHTSMLSPSQHSDIPLLQDEENVKTSSECLGECLAYRATAISLAVLLVVVLLVIVLLLVIWKRYGGCPAASSAREDNYLL